MEEENIDMEQEMMKAAEEERRLLEEKKAMTATATMPAPPAAAPQAMSFDEIKEKAQGQEARNIDFIMDIPLRVSVELGRTRVLVGELLRMSHGSVIELDKLAGEPMEVMVNDKLVAKGEVVLVNDKLGIRLTDIVSPTERIKKLA